MMTETTTTELQPMNPISPTEREQKWHELIEELGDDWRDAYPLFSGYTMLELSDEVFLGALAMIRRVMAERSQRRNTASA